MSIELPHAISIVSALAVIIIIEWQSKKRIFYSSKEIPIFFWVGLIAATIAQTHVIGTFFMLVAASTTFRVLKSSSPKE